MHAHITGWNTHTYLSVWVCWFGVSDRVRGDFSNHLRWGRRKIRSACEGWAASKLIISSQAYIIISQVSPIRECWCGISAQISYSHRFHYREKRQDREEPRDWISRIPQKILHKWSFTELWRWFQLSEPSFQPKLCCVHFCCVFTLRRCGFVVWQRCSQRLNIKKVRYQFITRGDVTVVLMLLYLIKAINKHCTLTV